MQQQAKVIQIPETIYNGKEFAYATSIWHPHESHERTEIRMCVILFFLYHYTVRLL
jgi:hypothetical protein